MHYRSTSWFLLAAVASLAVSGTILTVQWSNTYADTRAQTAVQPSPSAGSAIATSAYLINCAHQPVSEPTEYTVTCGGAHSGIEHVTWTSWGGGHATGTGTYVENTCTPTCAAGLLDRYPIKLLADRIRVRDGSGVYRSITISFVESAPNWVVGSKATFDVDFGATQ